MGAITGGGSGGAPNGVVFNYAAGNALPSPTFARTGTATYTALISDVVFNYSPTLGLATATFARTGTATFNQDVG